MGTSRALVIALEHYASVNGVRYARNDANAVASALQDLGFEIPSHTLLLDQYATKATIESRLRTELAGLRSGDRFALYYAGHGLSVNGSNYITCYDTQPGDLEKTSIPLAMVYDSLRQAESSQILVFLDSCHSGLELGDSARRITDHLSASELVSFFEESEYCLCFSSCKVDQVSISDPSLAHGVWTYHLTKALRAEATEILMGDGLLTASALQDYLSVEVPRTIRQLTTIATPQTPWLFGGASRDGLVADLSLLLAKQRVTVTDVLPASRELALVGESEQLVKDLDGFSKRQHHVPYEINDWTKQFVVRCSREDLKDLREKYYRAIKNEFGYKRKDLLVSDGDGSIAIVAPAFSLIISCAQSETTPSKAVFRYEIREIGDPKTIEDAAFSSVFEDVVNRLEIITDRAIDITAIVDGLEEVEPEGVEFDYPVDCSYCEITFRGSRHSIRLEPYTIIFEPGRTGEPKSLVDGFRETIELLLSHPALSTGFLGLPRGPRPESLSPNTD